MPKSEPLSEPLVFGGRVFATETVRTTMRRSSARFRFRETGGVLLGYRVGEDIVVTEATGPGPHALHGRTFFRPDTRYCQRCLEEAYEQTEGVVTYLGEWHSHPHGSSWPSRKDCETMAGIAGDADYRQPEPLLWIYRPSDVFLPWYYSEEMAVWVFAAGNEYCELSKPSGSSMFGVRDHVLVRRVKDTLWVQNAPVP
jgi:integrative and conjugative element protein (TIGR02256 family)